MSRQRDMKEYTKTVNPNDTIIINKKGFLTMLYGMYNDHMEPDKMLAAIESAFHEARHDGDFKCRTYYGIE